MTGVAGPGTEPHPGAGIPAHLGSRDRVYISSQAWKRTHIKWAVFLRCVFVSTVFACKNSSPKPQQLPKSSINLCRGRAAHCQALRGGAEA